jgi:uncharacterized protein
MTKNDGPDTTGTALETRLERLRAILREAGSVCIGYSGGVDSAFLAVFAVEAIGRANVLAVTALSDSYPDVQRRTADEVAERFGVPHITLRTDELNDPRYAANPVNRCYFCKTELWDRLVDVAKERGMTIVIDGSNADDATDHRPGAKAARERGVRSPLQEAGLTKHDIREASHALGLPTWDQPASPCLASRLPYGIAVTSDRLRQVEDAESLLRRYGFREFRVRHHGDAARVEVAPSEMVRALSMAEAIAAGLRALGFERVLLDVEGYRRGALNESLPLAPAGAS